MEKCKGLFDTVYVYFRKKFLKALPMISLGGKKMYRGESYIIFLSNLSYLAFLLVLHSIKDTTVLQG